jgi:hypothetical protein
MPKLVQRAKVIVCRFGCKPFNGEKYSQSWTDYFIFTGHRRYNPSINSHPPMLRRFQPAITVPKATYDFGVVSQAVRMFEFPRDAPVEYLTLSGYSALTGGDGTQVRELAHSIGNRVIGAGAVTADDKTADYLCAGVERYAATERDDSAEGAANTASMFKETRIEGIRVVQPIKRAARLRGGVEVCGGKRKRIIAEAVCCVGLGNRNGATARPRIAGFYYRAQMAFAIHNRRPHSVGLENSAIRILCVDDPV